MTALAPVEEVEIDVHGQTVATEAHRQRPLHLVGVERATAFLAGRTVDGLARVGGDPHLGIDPGDRDARGPHLLRRHDAELGDPVGVGLVLRPLVDGLRLRHDAVGAHLARLRDERAHDHQIVELEELVVLEHDTELGGPCVFGAEDAPDVLVGHEALGSITAARSAR